MVKVNDTSLLVWNSDPGWASQTSGFRVLGFSGLGFRVLGFSGLGFRV